MQKNDLAYFIRLQQLILHLCKVSETQTDFVTCLYSA